MNSKNLLSSSFKVILGVIIGSVITGVPMMLYLVNNTLTDAALELDHDVIALALIQKERNDEAVRYIEAIMRDKLILLSSGNVGQSEETITSVSESLSNAKKYHLKYPIKTSNQELDSFIEALFSNVD